MPLTCVRPALAYFGALSRVGCVAFGGAQEASSLAGSCGVADRSKTLQRVRMNLDGRHGAVARAAGCL